MARIPKFSVGLWVLDGTSDRFCRGGYSEFLSIEEQIKKAGKVTGCSAIECHQIDFDQLAPKKFVKILADNGLVVSNVNTNVWSDPIFKHGAFTHRDRNVRQQALDEARQAVDMARQVGSPSIGLWLGSDGTDYPFQVDFTEQWDLLIDGIRQIGDYASPDIKVGVEYKLKEPRNHVTIGSVGKAAALCLELGMENVGVAVDFGHALMSRENPGESVAYIARHNKLFNVHLNDAYREWDDDMIPGSVHFWETLEFLYYCKVTGYNGWFGLDMFPYREDGVQAAIAAIRNIKALWKLLDALPVEQLRRAQRRMDVIALQNLLRRFVLGPL